MLNPIPDYTQPDGYHFVDSSSGLSVRIDGTSYADVAEKVLKYRLSNGLPPGEPLRELYDYVCRRHPVICRDTSPRPEQPVERRRSLADRVAAWVSNWFQTSRGDKGVSSAETDRRSEICAGCAHNTPITGCGSCVANIDRLVFIWRRDRPVPREKALGGCLLLGQHNVAAALSSNLPPVADDVRPLLPPGCWRKA